MKQNVALEGHMQWQSICDRILSLSHRIRSIIVKWGKRARDWIKINTDGSSLKDGSSGAGGIVRDHGGKLIMAFSQQIDNGTNNYAVAKVVLYGVQWCKESGYKRINLECDSMIVI